jgi:hypothetical protein
VIERQAAPLEDELTNSSAVAAMLNQVLRIAARRHVPVERPDRDVQQGEAERGWHSSSFDLARGLDVIEHFNSQGGGLVPAVQRPERPFGAA